MARFTVQGLDEYILELNKLESNTDEIIGKAVYEGASVVADAIRANLAAIPSGGPLTKPTKRGLLEGFGISPLQKKLGYHHVKVGFDGYNGLRTKTYPKGQPNVLVARSVENGSSIYKKHPFIKPAVRETQEKCEQTMARVLDEEIERLMK